MSGIDGLELLFIVLGAFGIAGLIAILIHDKRHKRS
jgi:hypothetical protein